MAPTDGPRISLQITAGEPLISGVKEGVVALLQHHVCDPTALFLGRIDTGRVMRAGMEEEDGTVQSGGKGTEELVAGKTNRLGIVILVGERIDSDVPEDGEVVYCENGTEGVSRYPTCCNANHNVPHVGLLR
jgi:hypothetical protein